jgi:hypothetical protein
MQYAFLKDFWTVDRARVVILTYSFKKASLAEMRSGLVFIAASSWTMKMYSRALSQMAGPKNVVILFPCSVSSV